MLVESLHFPLPRAGRDSACFPIESNDVAWRECFY